MGLPARDYMEAALETWRREGLPELQLRRPWYGSKLSGLWSEEDEENAPRAVCGETLTRSSTWDG